MTSRHAPAQAWLFHAVSAAILLFLVLPTLIIVPMSFSPTPYLHFPPAGLSLQWYRAYLFDPDWIDATLFSAQIAGWTTLASTVIGTMGSVALVRGRLPGRQTVEALLLAPLIVPPVIVAIGVYLQFAPLGLTGTVPGFVLIHTALAVPYVVLVVTAALQRVPPSLELAGLNLGASRLTCFRRITLPMIAPRGAGPGRCSPSSPRSTRRWCRSSSPVPSTRPSRARCSRTSSSTCPQ